MSPRPNEHARITTSGYRGRQGAPNPGTKAEMKIHPGTGTAICYDKRPSSHPPRQGMRTSRILMWAFADAPRELRLLHRASPVPEWLALVPRNLLGSDLEEIMTGNAKSSDVFRYETAMKDIVYIGSSCANEAHCLESLPSTFTRPADSR
jgi:hypothetical protein